MLSFKNKTDLKNLTEEQKVQLCKELNEHAGTKGGYGKYLQTVGLGKSITALAKTFEEIGISKLNDQYLTKEQAQKALSEEEEMSEQDKLQELIKHFDKIMELINPSKLNVVPVTDLQPTSVRIGAQVWQEWKDFCKRTPYNTGDLITNALMEYLNKYDTKSTHAKIEE